MGVTVRFNRLPKVIADMHDNVDSAVDSAAGDIGTIAKLKAPVDTGVLVRTTKPDGSGSMHAVVESGIYRGHGFYAGFQEFGTRHHGAQPYMVPAAHAGEVILERKVTDAVRDACNV